MLSTNYLVQGVAALARIGSAKAGRPDPRELLMRGHAAAAAIAAYYLAHRLHGGRPGVVCPRVEVGARARAYPRARAVVLAAFRASRAWPGG